MVSILYFHIRNSRYRTPRYFYHGCRRLCSNIRDGTRSPTPAAPACGERIAPDTCFNYYGREAISEIPKHHDTFHEVEMQDTLPNGVPILCAGSTSTNGCVSRSMEPKNRDAMKSRSLEQRTLCTPTKNFCEIMQLFPSRIQDGAVECQDRLLMKSIRNNRLLFRCEYRCHNDK